MTSIELSTVKSNCEILRRSANLSFRWISPVDALGFRQVAITCPLSLFSSSCFTCRRQKLKAVLLFQQNYLIYYATKILYSFDMWRQEFTEKPWDCFKLFKWKRAFIHHIFVKWTNCIALLIKKIYRNLAL